VNSQRTRGESAKVKTGCAVKTRCQTPENESYIGSSRFIFR
jgi:hypothetical protein